MKVTIIGAGIGGLTLAIALQKKGIAVEIFEATPEFKKVGAGIVLAINAMQVYQRLNLVDAIKSAGNCLEGMAITNANLSPLGANTLDYFEDQYKLNNIAIHRADLHEVLLNALPNVALHLNKRLKKLTSTEEGVALLFEDGTSYQRSIVIGADGIHSQVRQAIFPTIKERFANQLCWRGVADFKLPQNEVANLKEAWGKGRRFGIVPIGNNRVYWFACVSYQESTLQKINETALVTLFENFNPLVTQLIKATDSNKLIKGELSDLELLPQWYDKRICLMGDAAHATTPNMGQGANQAIESAWVLANFLAKEKRISKAFERYQKVRQAKARGIIKTSWQIGKIAHIANPIGVTFRNTFMRLIPDFVGRMQLKKVFELNY